MLKPRKFTPWHMAELLMLSLMRYGMMALFVIFPAITSFEQYASAQTEPSRVLLTADNVYFDEDTNTVTAEGNVEAKYEDRIMRADRLTYDRVRDIVRASGN
ncbi:MAG: LptA/OstA family protein, partial [Henriciella sp.]